jgi:VanZ family protein
MNIPYSTKVTRILYTTLLIITPFLLLQNYLQDMIGVLSRSSVTLLDISIPLVPVGAGVLAAVLAYALRKKLNTRRLVVLGCMLLMDMIGQNSTDYYFNHKFYDLQHNWHYLAYGIYAVIVYRDLKQRRVSSAKIALVTFGSTFIVSFFDELIQVFISNRIFDVCDIGKDLWGSVIGIVLVLFFLDDGKILEKGWRLRRKKIADYLTHPLSVVFLEIILAYLFLFISSNFSDHEYWPVAFLLPPAVFVIFFFVFHTSQFPRAKKAWLIAGCLLFVVQVFFSAKYVNDDIVYQTRGLTVYKGMPIPYFDILIFPNGMFRFVDKKHSFNRRDIQTIYEKTVDILLVGTGIDGEGGLGFPEITDAQFVFNKVTGRAMQVILLKNQEASAAYSRLRREGKRVLFIIHNS